MSNLTNLIRPRLVGIAIGMAIILFLAVNVFSTNAFRSSRADMTESGLYSLSDGTRNLLSKLEEPLHFRFFLSENLVQTAPQLSAYAKRVRSVLETYASRANGKITLEVIDPEPFSDAEDRAVGMGINRIRNSGVSDPLFFGLAVTNSTDGRANIPIFSPDREAFLEYDLTRLVAELGQTSKPLVAVLDGIGLAGNPAAGMPQQQVLTQLMEIYDVEVLNGDVDAFPENTRVVLAAHPHDLSERTLYALDQWVLSGGATMIFVDPHAETQMGQRPGMPPADSSSGLDTLLSAWGVEFSTEKTVADPVYAIRTLRKIGDQEIEVPNYPWLSLREDGMDPSDATVSQLSNLILTSSGAFTTKTNDVTITPLLTASPDAGFIATADTKDQFGDPRRLLGKIEKTEQPVILAGRLSGKLKTAFPDGKPEGSEATGEARSELEVPAHVILVGDADMLMDRNWIQQRQIFGQPILQAFANNGDFVLNTVEQMIGGVTLADLRGRGISWRPFERIVALQNAAEAKFRAKEQELVTRLQETERKIRELDTGANDGEEGEFLSQGSFQAIEQFRADLLSTRAQLRAVQHDLRRDVEHLKTWITTANVGVFPAIVAACALGFSLRKPRCSVPSRRSENG